MKSLDVNLIHGENDYLIYKNLKDQRKSFESKSIEVKELFGSKSLNIKEILDSLQSASLFGDSSVLILRELSDGKSFFPFVEDLVEYLKSAKDISNQLHIFNTGKVLKTSKIYKIINSKGKITEFASPKEPEVLDVIHKSLSIKPMAAKLLFQYTNGNLFQIKNEIKKLQTLQQVTDTEIIDEKDVEINCVRMTSQNEVWDLGKVFLNAAIEKNIESKLDLINKVEIKLEQETESMQILYSFYQYTLNAIKMKRLIKKGKGFRDVMSLGYFFVNEFFSKSSKINMDEMLRINSELIDYEFNLKSGKIDEIIGLKRLILNL